MPKFTRLPSFDLPDEHPAIVQGRQKAYRCSECNGFFFPKGEPTECPYCTDEND